MRVRVMRKEGESFDPIARRMIHVQHGQCFVETMLSPYLHICVRVRVGMRQGLVEGC